MAMVELKGLHIVRTAGQVYVYAWRGGPRVKAALGSSEFMASYNEAVAARRTPDNGKFLFVIQSYRSSAEFERLAATTKRIWSRWLDRIAGEFGNVSIAMFGRAEKIRPVIREWRGRLAHQPRTADYAMQVLSRVLSHAVDPMGKIASNPCEGIKGLYASDRSDIIWTADDIARLRAVASPAVMLAVDLAAETGLRAADLFRLSWSHIHDDAIVITTSKSRFTKEAVIPLHDSLLALLATIPKRSPVILTNSRGTPWTNINSSLRPAMKSAKLSERKLHFHDLRGTAATRFYLANLTERVIAEIMGWEEDHVRRIIRRYVDRGAAVQAVILQMRQARTGTDGVKRTVKLAED